METTKYYTTRFVFNKGRVKVWKAINEYLQKFIPENSTILDIGCGYADFINGIIGDKKIAIDLNPEIKKFIESDKIKFINQSILNQFNVDDLSIDVIFASNLFEHFNDAELDIIINNIKAKLKPNGKLILIQPNIYYAFKEYWDDYTHKKAFSHNSLNDLLNSYGFKTLVIKKKFIPFSLKSMLPKSYWLTKFYLKSPIKPFAKQLLIITQKIEIC